MNKVMAKTVLDYIPKKKPKEKTHLVQANIPKELADDILTYMEENDLDWTKLVKACFYNLRDTVINKKK